jgi:hypothetical protein
MQQIGEAAKLYVWFQIIGSAIVLPVVLYTFWFILSTLRKILRKIDCPRKSNIMSASPVRDRNGPFTDQQLEEIQDRVLKTILKHVR